MRELYDLLPPTQGPAPPERWTYSSLADWRDCPRRWWLSRASYPNVQGRIYPEPLTPAVLRGILLHAALEAFEEHRRMLQQQHRRHVPLAEARESFPVRAVIRETMRYILTDGRRNSPRSSPERLKANVQLDDCINLFRDAMIVLMDAPSRRGRHPTARHRPHVGNTVGNGAEVKIAVTDPPLQGRLDLSTGGAIVDFKTGEPCESHQEQLKFYALLWWLRTGTRPTALVLAYIQRGERIAVDVPSEAALAESRDRLRLEIVETHRVLSMRRYVRAIGQVGIGSGNGRASSSRELTRSYIDTGEVPASPEVTICRWCPVRQHCDVYWTAPETARCRAPSAPDGDDPPANRTWWLDVQLTTLPHRQSHLPVSGTAYSPDLGSVHVFIDQDHCPGPSDMRPIGARILSARVAYRNEGWSMTSGANTEIFWLPHRA